MRACEYTFIAHGSRARCCVLAAGRISTALGECIVGHMQLVPNSTTSASFTVAFDDTGAISMLTTSTAPTQSWASAQRPLAALVYQTLNESDWKPFTYDYINGYVHPRVRGRTRMVHGSVGKTDVRDVCVSLGCARTGLTVACTFTAALFCRGWVGPLDWWCLMAIKRTDLVICHRLRQPSCGMEWLRWLCVWLVGYLLTP